MVPGQTFWLVSLAWLGSLVLAAAAPAATVEQFVQPVPCGGDRYGQPCAPIRGVSYKAEAGEANRVSYTPDSTGVLFRDGGAPLKAGAGCAKREDGAVHCGGLLDAGLRIETGDAADVVKAEGGVAVSARIDAGPGDDAVTAGAADDAISGGGGRDELHGGVGDDVLADGDGAAGDGDVLDGGPDRLPRDGFDRGAGDVLSYEDHEADLQVDLGAPQGPDGDGLTGFEVVRGGKGDDRLTATDAGDPLNLPVGLVPTLDGGPGNDVLRGGDAADWLDGGPGGDAVSGGGGDDLLTGDGGDDRLSGGAGDDRLFGGAGADRFSGAGGDDHLDTRDGIREVARCGGGIDTVGGLDVDEFNDAETQLGPDSTDRLAGDCERVPAGGDYARLGAIVVQPLRVGAATIQLRNACKPCAGGAVRLRVGTRTIAAASLRGRRIVDLPWRPRAPRGRSIDVRVSWELVAKGDKRSEFLPYGYTIRLRVPR